MKQSNKIAKILEGVGLVISLFPQENKRKITLPNSSISNSLEHDWEKIGSDMWTVCVAIESKQSEKYHRNNDDRLEKYPRLP